ncbi:hypothetical protein M0804_012252 [Polistes exclamans]|nr:hypothetical protein M0804_012252 [Polistes exclamans]
MGRGRRQQGDPPSPPSPPPPLDASKTGIIPSYIYHHPYLPPFLLLLPPSHSPQNMPCKIPLKVRRSLTSAQACGVRWFNIPSRILMPFPAPSVTYTRKSANHSHGIPSALASTAVDALFVAQYGPGGSSFDIKVTPPAVGMHRGTTNEIHFTVCPSRETPRTLAAPPPPSPPPSPSTLTPTPLPSTTLFITFRSF